MTLQSLTYISSSRLDPEMSSASVAEIVKASVANNKIAGLTGALVFTGTYFIQILEGSANSLNQLMAVLGQDTRHGGVKVVGTGEISHRRFASWQMAYVGPSMLVDRRVRRLIGDANATEANRVSEWLERLLADSAPKG